MRGFGPEALARPDHHYKVAEIGEAGAAPVKVALASISRLYIRVEESGMQQATDSDALMTTLAHVEFECRRAGSTSMSPRTLGMHTNFRDLMRLQLCLKMFVSIKDEACRLGQYDARPIF